MWFTARTTRDDIAKGANAQAVTMDEVKAIVQTAISTSSVGPASGNTVPGGSLALLSPGSNDSSQVHMHVHHALLVTVFEILTLTLTLTPTLPTGH